MLRTSNGVLVMMRMAGSTSPSPHETPPSSTLHPLQKSAVLAWQSACFAWRRPLVVLLSAIGLRIIPMILFPAKPLPI